MYLLLVNPKAGNNRYNQIERKIKRVLDRNNVKHKIVTIADLSDVPDLLEQHVKDNTRAVVAVGGNGTVASVIDALAGYDLALGIIPVSKSNSLASTLGIKNWMDGVKLLSNHDVVPRRLGKIGQRYFLGNLTVAPRRNLLNDILGRHGWAKRFVGANIMRNLKGPHSVACEMKLDSHLTVNCQVVRIDLQLQDEGSKRMMITVHVLDGTKPSPSILRANRCEISSSLNMPVLSGNETVANTPATIAAVGKSIPVVSKKPRVNQAASV